MSKKLNMPVRAANLARLLGLPMLGRERDILQVGGLDELEENCLSFIRDRSPEAGADGTVFASQQADGLTVILSKSPRLDFIRAQHVLERNPGFMPEKTPPRIHPTARIGAGAVIDNGVAIGEGTRIGEGAVIRSGTRIGKHSDIFPGAVLGEAGFGFERDENGLPLRMAQLGGLLIGDHVDVGSLATIARGALGDTVVEDHVKIDDHAHIGHNCRIGSGTIIAGCAKVCGSVRIGRRCWISPNCTIMQKSVLGDGCFVCIGAVVLGSVEAGAKVFGNPARAIAVP